MKFKKDISLDIIYSILFAVVIIFEFSGVKKVNESLILIFKNFIAISILILWMKALSRNNSGAILIQENKNTSISLSYILLVIEFIKYKLTFVIIGFVCYYFLEDRIELIKIGYYTLQTLAIGFYTISCYLISKAFFKSLVNSWQFLLLTLAPYFLLFIFNGITESNYYFHFAIIPSNINLLFHYNINSLSYFVLSVLSLITFITTCALGAISIKNYTSQSSLTFK